MVDEKEFEEKEYYRRRLRQWRELGFDTTELEVMLETDFARLKESKFDELKRQLHLMTSEETIPKVAKKEPVRQRRDPHRVETATITEYDDIGTSQEQIKEDLLEDIRKEMERRKASETFRVHDISREFRDPPPKVKARPEGRPRSATKDPDYPLISFKKNPKDPVDRNILEEGPKEKALRELELIEEEEALLKRKRHLIEQEEERLRRKRRIMAQLESEDLASGERDDMHDEEDERREEEERGEEEPALIFVDKVKEEPEEEPEEEEEEVEEEHIARISVADVPEEEHDDELDRLINEMEEDEGPDVDDEELDRILGVKDEDEEEEVEEEEEEEERGTSSQEEKEGRGRCDRPKETQEGRPQEEKEKGGRGGGRRGRGGRGRRGGGGGGGPGRGRG